MRRRSASVAATIRALDARTSASCERTSAASRSFSSTSPAVARTDSTSAGSSSNAGSWTSAATSSPCGGHQRDRPIRALRELERPAGSVDVAAVVESIRNVEGRVAEDPGEALAQAGRALCPQLDDEVGRLASMQARQTIPATTPSGTSSATARPIVSSVAAPSPVALTQTSHSTVAGTMRPAATSSGACARRAGPRRTSRRPASRKSTASATAMPRIRLRAVDGVGHGLLRRNREHVPRVGQHEARRRADRRASPTYAAAIATRAARDHGRPSGNVSTNWTSSAAHSAVEQEAERPQARASSPTGDRRPEARKPRRRAELSIGASAPAPARRGMPPRAPTTARGPRPRAFPRRPRRLRASRRRGPRPRPRVRAAPGHGARCVPATSVTAVDDITRRSAANAAADSLDFGMKPRAPQASIRRP